MASPRTSRKGKMKSWFSMASPRKRTSRKGMMKSSTSGSGTSVSVSQVMVSLIKDGQT